jgi:TonB-dependent receptor
LKSQLNLKKALITVLFVIISAAVFAQTGKISGKVSDKKTGETLIGATVKIKGTAKGASTDVDGNYVISGVNAGKHIITLQYIGYNGKEIDEVEVSNGKITVLNVILEEASSQNLSEVVIRASFKQESVNTLYAQQKNSATISDGISSDVIKKSPDRNTGEVLKRVSGASVQDNKFIIVRGLSDRYNSAMINNSPLPSTEADRKTFSFDAIPSNLVDNVVISKTATPDLPGDFSGGAVQIKTKDFPETRTLELNVGMGYNTISTFKDFYGNGRAAVNYLGFAGKDSRLPSGFPSIARYQALSAEQRVTFSRKFKNTWGINNLGTTAPTQNLQMIFGNSYSLKNDSKIGFIASLTYRSGQSISDEVRNDYNEVIGDSKGVPIFEYNDQFYNFNSTMGVLANVAYTKGSNKISLKNIYNQSYDESTLVRAGMADQVLSQQVSQQEINEKSLLNSVLEGDHLLSKASKAKLNWNLSYSQITNNLPDLRRLTYALNTTQNQTTYLAQVNSTVTAETGGRFFSELDESIYSAGLNYALPVNLFKQGQAIKLGVLKQYKDRKFDARTLGYERLTPTPEEGTALISLPQDRIFDLANIASNKLLIKDISNPSNNYTGSGDLNAGYAMISGTFTKKIKATIGLRIENYLENLDSRNNSGKVVVDNDYLDFLPSANLTYELTPKANFRLSYSNTVARAQFRELAPFAFYDFVTGLVKLGEPELKRTTISNLDVRYEFYPTAGQMISISGFYKKLSDPIESIVVDGSNASSKSMTFANAPKAQIAGVEFEIRHDLGFLSEGSGFFKRLIYSANAAVIKSEVDFGAQRPTINNNRALQGQSPYLINTGLQYSTDKTGWQASVLYNRIGRRISVVGFGRTENNIFLADYPDIYEAPRDLIDLQIAKKVIKDKAEIKLNISNILDSDARFYQDLNDDKKFVQGEDQLINRVRYGRTFSLSFGYKF